MSLRSAAVISSRNAAPVSAGGADVGVAGSGTVGASWGGLAVASDAGLVVVAGATGVAVGAGWIGVGGRGGGWPTMLASRHVPYPTEPANTRIARAIPSFAAAENPAGASSGANGVAGKGEGTSLEDRCGFEAGTGLESAAVAAMISGDASPGKR